MALRIMGLTLPQLRRRWQAALDSAQGEALGVRTDTTHIAPELDLWEELEHVFAVPLAYSPCAAGEAAVYCCEHRRRLIVVAQAPGIGLWAVDLTLEMAGLAR